MSRDYRFEQRGRTHRTAILLIAIYVAMALAMALLDAAWWVMAILALFTLPALLDYARDTKAGLCLGPDVIVWHTGRREGSIDLAEIDFMRFDTRLDLSVRVSAVLVSGRKIRLPYECLPPHREFEGEFAKRGIRVERHHFSIL